MPYLFKKKRWFKSEMNSFCIWNLKNVGQNTEEIWNGRKKKKNI
jgi:hypothetical protein